MDPNATVSYLVLKPRIILLWFISRVFLLRQLWIVNYYVKSSSNNLRNANIKDDFGRPRLNQNTKKEVTKIRDEPGNNLSNENIKTGVSREIIFQK